MWSSREKDVHHDLHNLMWFGGAGLQLLDWSALAGYGSSATALMELLQMIRPMPGSMMMIREKKKLHLAMITS
jgi:hypothetical protein